MKKFKKSNIKFFLKPTKGLSKKYMIDCIFNEDIQNNWQPKQGDMMVGPTGNVFFISNTYDYDNSIGGTMYYFGGQSCSRDGSSYMDLACCYTANESGEYWKWTEEGLKKADNHYHSSIREFRYVPYPHEL